MDPKPRTAWSSTFAGVTACVGVVVLIVTLLRWHEDRPHEGAVTIEQYDKQITEISRDIREIRNIIVSQRVK